LALRSIDEIEVALITVVDALFERDSALFPVWQGDASFS
jgi:hypothetical protein